MDEESQQTTAVWVFLFVSFLLLAGFLYIHEAQLTIELVGLYWFPAIVLTIIGTILPPWEPLVSYLVRVTDK